MAACQFACWLSCRLGDLWSELLNCLIKFNHTTYMIVNWQFSTEQTKSALPYLFLPIIFGIISYTYYMLSGIYIFNFHWAVYLVNWCMVDCICALQMYCIAVTQLVDYLYPYPDFFLYRTGKCNEDQPTTYLKLKVSLLMLMFFTGEPGLGQAWTIFF